MLRFTWKVINQTRIPHPPSGTEAAMSVPWGPLDEGITSRYLDIRDLKMHILEASPLDGAQNRSKHPLIILLHGFPELSYSWRKLLVPLANNGYRVVAPDQRGYGRTTSKEPREGGVRYEDDISPYRMANVVQDIVALVGTLGYTKVTAVIGHDFGSPVAAHCALIHPDIFTSVVMMSAPFTGPQPPSPPPLPSPVQNVDPNQPNDPAHNDASPFWRFVDLTLGSFDLKHYTSYFSSSTANEDMLNAQPSLHAFLRSYFHIKSADWLGNDPRVISPNEFSHLPGYYIMPSRATMPQVAQENAPSSEEVSQNSWLSDAELRVSVEAFESGGFQEGLNWYRCMRDPVFEKDMEGYIGRRLEMPAMFIGGAKDWGVYQNTGAVEKMKREVCTNMAEEDFVLVEGAGHWVQQEKPGEVLGHLERFLKKV